jgi:hypothetical protein
LDGQKRIILENAVSNISELQQVKNNADIKQTRSGSILTLDQNLNILLSVSMAYDNQIANRKAKRNILLYDIHEHDEEDCDDETYDLQSLRFLPMPVSDVLRVGVPLSSQEFKCNGIDGLIWMTRANQFGINYLTNPKQPF